MKKNQKGFTLIELLVVIAIIGLLSTLSIVALNQARIRARDARRVADVKQIQTALEMYYNEVGSYPATAELNMAGTGSIATSGSVFMQVIPIPPTPADNTACVGTTRYTYAQTSAGTSYTLQYCLGATTGAIPAGLNTASSSGIK